MANRIFSNMASPFCGVQSIKVYDYSLSYSITEASSALRPERHPAAIPMPGPSRGDHVGNNITTLTLHISRWLVRNLQAGDNILVTRLDHDANSPLDANFWVCSSYKYFEPQITRHLQFHRPPGHRKDKTVTFWNQIPKWVMSYNQCSSPISFSECIQ